MIQIASLSLALLAASELLPPAGGSAPAQEEARQETRDEPKDLSTAEYFEWLARIRLTQTVDRRLDDALKELVKLTEWAMLQDESKETTLDVKSVLVESALLRAEITLDREGPKAASAYLDGLQTLDRVAPGAPGAPSAPSFQSTARSVTPAYYTELRKQYATWARTGRIANFRETLAEAALRERPDNVEELVRELALRGQFEQVLQLGTRAVPALKARVLRDLDDFPGSANQDALALLVDIDEAAGAELILENLERGGPAWRGRVHRAMRLEMRAKRAGVLENRDAWEYSGGFPCSSRRPHWLRVLEKLTALPDVWPESIRMIAPVVRHGALTPALSEALKKALRSSDPNLVQAAVDAIEVRFQSVCTQDVLESAVDHPSEHIRIFVASQLLKLPKSAALLTRATDPLPTVREAVARSLSEREVEVPLVAGTTIVSGGGYSGGENRIRPSLSTNERAVVKALLRDSNDDVRRAALKALWELTEPLEDEVYLALTSDPVEGHRREMAAIAPKLPIELHGRVLEKLVDDPSRNVLRSIDLGLHEVKWAENPTPLLPVLRKRVQHPTYPMWVSDNNRAARILKWASETDEGLNGLIDWIVADRDVRLLARVPLYALLRLDAPRMVDLFPILFEIDVRACASLAKDIQRKVEGAHLREPLVQLSADPSLAPALRALAAGCGASAGGATFVASMSAACSARDYWTPALLERDNFAEWLGACVRISPAADGNQIALNVVRDREIKGDLAVKIGWHFDESGPLAREVSREILARWFDDTPHYARSAVEKVIKRMARFPEDADGDVLRATVARRQFEYAAVEAIGQIRTPEYLPLLEEILRTRPGTNLWSNAMVATANYMNDDAAEVLLKAATWASDSHGRAGCLEHLEAIRTFQEAKERWASRRVAKKDRADAIVELIGMLDDENQEVRYYAVKALATFEAVEAIPRLIQILKSDDKFLADTVREALERLNETPAGEK